MPTTLSKLPDLVLLEVFANVPLLELFTTIPLVCHNWHRLQRPALFQRNRLYLVPVKTKDNKVHSWIRHLAEDVVGQRGIEVIDDPELDWWHQWCLTLVAPLDPGVRCSSTAYLLDTLPLPVSSRAKGVSHMGALSSPETVKYLAKCLPNLTELTIYCPQKQAPTWQDAVVIVRHIAQLIQCYKSKLTVLRLYLPIARGKMMGKQVDKLVTVLNDIGDEKSRLHSLQLTLGYCKKNDNTKLSVKLVNQLGHLMVHIRHLHPDTLKAIKMPQQTGPKRILLYRQIEPDEPRQPTAEHIRLLDCIDIVSWESLSPIFDDFRGLTALNVIIDARHDNVHLVPRTLATLPALTRLSLFLVQSPAVEVESHPVVLPGVRHLLLKTFAYDHNQIDRLQLSTYFPSLEHLYFECAPCSECRRFPKTKVAKCVQAMLSYLKSVCLSLLTVRFADREEEWVFTRADVTKEFREQ